LPGSATLYFSSMLSLAEINVLLFILRWFFPQIILFSKFQMLFVYSK
jgi:hypothetical protein